MRPTIVGHESVDYKERPVHAWRVLQLTRLGIPGSLAEATPTTWTGIRSPGWPSAAVPPLLALRIVR